MTNRRNSHRTVLPNPDFVYEKCRLACPGVPDVILKKEITRVCEGVTSRDTVSNLFNGTPTLTEHVREFETVLASRGVEDTTVSFDSDVRGVKDAISYYRKQFHDFWFAGLGVQERALRCTSAMKAALSRAELHLLEESQYRSSPGGICPFDMADTAYIVVGFGFTQCAGNFEEMRSHFSTMEKLDETFFRCGTVIGKEPSLHMQYLQDVSRPMSNGSDYYCRPNLVKNRSTIVEIKSQSEKRLRGCSFHKHFHPIRDRIFDLRGWCAFGDQPSVDRLNGLRLEIDDALTGQIYWGQVFITYIRNEDNAANAFDKLVEAYNRFMAYAGPINEDENPTFTLARAHAILRKIPQNEDPNEVLTQLERVISAGIEYTPLGIVSHTASSIRDELRLMGK